MKPSFHPHLVNGDDGDPALYVDLLFEGRAMLFDLGDLAALPNRKILRLSDVFVSHTHMDHFIGFDRLLRIMVGREKQLRLYGPSGFIDHTAHKLGAYTWNLVANYQEDFILTVTELVDEHHARRAQFRCSKGFTREDLPTLTLHNGVVLDEGNLQVRCAVLDHGIPCLGFALEEGLHINVWKNRLVERGLATGPWLQILKQAVLSGAADDTPIPVPEATQQRLLPLGELKRDLLRIVPGQKIAYVVDTVYTAENAQRIVALASGAEQLFIEAPFLERDKEHAAARRHLTARQAGELAHRAGARHCIPFHFSPRYGDEQQALLQEAMAAFHDS